MCCLCVLAVSLPTATLLPFNLLQQFRLVSEEEVETGGLTLAEARVERRNPPPVPVRQTHLAHRPNSSRGDLPGACAASRGEFRFLNGTGSRLLC